MYIDIDIDIDFYTYMCMCICTHIYTGCVRSGIGVRVSKSSKDA